MCVLGEELSEQADGVGGRVYLGLAHAFDCRSHPLKQWSHVEVDQAQAFCKEPTYNGG